MKRYKDKSQAILFVVAVILLITNIFLIFQNLSLRSQLSRAKPPQVEEGDVLDEFQAKNLNGIETKINYSANNRKRILLFFSTTCGYCHKQMKYWKELVLNADHQKYRTIAITTETDTQVIRDYMKSYEIEDWDVFSIKPEDAQKFKMLSTPVTAVVDNQGFVEKVWVGMWQTSDIHSASNYFALNFSKTDKIK